MLVTLPSAQDRCIPFRFLLGSALNPIRPTQPVVLAGRHIPVPLYSYRMDR